MNQLPALPLDVLPRSQVAAAGCLWGLAREDEGGTRLVVLLPPASPILAELEGEREDHAGRVLLAGPTSPRNAAVLRRRLPWLAPVTIGTRPSAGFGDRLGLATPGHVRALRAAAPGIAPIFAQQSIREMARTGRTPGDVLDDATWGAFEEGWGDGVGADADHLKTGDEIDRCLAAGFTLFTLDPGACVDTANASGGRDAVSGALEKLPWDLLESSAQDLAARYVGRPFETGGPVITFDEETVARAAVKYGAAVAHVCRLYRHLLAGAGERRFEIEVSVDETDEPTSHAEHVLVATELRRLGVRWVSLAPRFVGRFEKGVDYIGDAAAFEAHVAGHAAIARALGPYKLSLHSGSDKFSIYDAVARHAGPLVHLKTAGTSYLEALRVVAALDPALFAEIFTFACDRYEEDRRSYHVSADVRHALAAAGDPERRAGLLDGFDARQVLHVTFGSVLRATGERGEARFAHRITSLLRRYPDTYAEALERHFVRHLAPFASHLQAPAPPDRPR
ncbi:MAG TPA: tagaturonate epimerase family protein [Vicinamibacterales bacterium]|nr:tagaturonate epimerase family protein [Vicinamibacterales bacterium]